MVKSAQNTSTQHHLVQAPSGLWLPRKYLSQKQTQSSTQQRPWPEKTLASKTLWEWMSLLLIPLLVGIGTIVVTQQQTDSQQQQFDGAQSRALQLRSNDIQIAQQARLNDIQIAQQARFDDILRSYQDGIDTLILDKNLKTSPSGSDVKSIAHSRTLDVLRQVDASRKEKVIAYLDDLGLIQGGYQEYVNGQLHWHKKELTISLSGADLDGVDLNYTNLYGADLSFANLSFANLSYANLYGADLTGANLYGTYLGGANLSFANLSMADLRGADLYGANLTGANLGFANLYGANLDGAKHTTPSQLSEAILFPNTIMPDGTKHTCKSEDQDYCQ